ncbi:thioredoxin-dependent thiol peroxidase [Candidatus Uhrbacteria bacterium]|nr:thioredoxin-dependent thiol peroxidase [Candidatus Uhrbacteria bacterium]
MHPSIGHAAPDFSLQDQSGETHTIAKYRGSWVLLYFYPKDDTPGCTTEACTIRDQYRQFSKRKLVVLGVSVDSVKSHAKFAKKYDLPFSLLADEGKAVVRAYGVWGKKKFMGREYTGTKRVSFLIDPNGKIAKIYEDVKPAEHAAAVLVDQNIIAENSITPLSLSHEREKGVAITVDEKAAPRLMGRRSRP